VFAARVGGAQGDDGSGEDVDAAGQQRALEAGGQRLYRRRVRGE
jgi:hypothetical protein